MDIVVDKDTALIASLRIEHKSEQEKFSRVTGCDLKTGPIAEVVELPETPTADYYLSAVPVEVMAGFVGDNNNWSPLAEADEALKKLSELKQHTQWMNGVVFYLKGELSKLSGHSVFVDTPFALSSIYQGRYWDKPFALENYGKGNVTAILSTIISNWKDTADCDGDEVCPIPYGGRGRLYHQSALATIAHQGDFAAGKERLIAELWHDLKDSLSVDGEPLLDDENFEFAYIDPAIHQSKGEVNNSEPLLVNRTNGWRLRPTANTNIANFFLAGDYVQTHTDLATMEGACEAAKRAVNGIIASEGLADKPCEIYPLRRIRWFAPLRYIDSLFYRWFA
ncbi:FAD-dependent oxidoreductase [Oceanicoccus sagamiensis]|uniref:FAD-dependent oxidoreductase n=1 Tax=Oceanicoccus sagamiensis TaxID=716816 RepID=UPI0012F48E62|nr:FAD-dependent oxidoreductase [Oceanicoccus sagamiensis]